jgi:hypothetical protein
MSPLLNPLQQLCVCNRSLSSQQLQPAAVEGMQIEPPVIQQVSTTIFHKSANPGSAVDSSSLDDMFRVTTVIQQIMTQLSGIV